MGLGPGSLDHLSKRAEAVLDLVETVAGYTTYVELIRPLLTGKQIISTGMTKEMERAEGAVKTACAGIPCALISSGDPGIYAMAGLVLDVCRSRKIPVAPPYRPGIGQGDPFVLTLEIVPGIPALCSAASLLGAPLTHDFAAVSLSDLLTPWERIAQRIEGAAKADFVIVLYNPKSKKRTNHLKKAQKIILGHRDKDTPVGIVTRAMRTNQEVEITTLGKLHSAPVNMQTTVFIGNSTSTTYMDFMITPRGYLNKYIFDPDKGDCENQTSSF